MAPGFAPLPVAVALLLFLGGGSWVRRRAVVGRYAPDLLKMQQRQPLRSPDNRTGRQHFLCGILIPPCNTQQLRQTALWCNIFPGKTPVFLGKMKQLFRFRRIAGSLPGRSAAGALSAPGGGRSAPSQSSSADPAAPAPPTAPPLALVMAALAGSLPGQPPPLPHYSCCGAQCQG